MRAIQALAIRYLCLATTVREGCMGGMQWRKAAALIALLPSHPFPSPILQAQPIARPASCLHKLSIWLAAGHAASGEQPRLSGSREREAPPQVAGGGCAERWMWVFAMWCASRFVECC